MNYNGWTDEVSCLRAPLVNLSQLPNPSLTIKMSHWANFHTTFLSLLVEKKWLDCRYLRKDLEEKWLLHLGTFCRFKGGMLVLTWMWSQGVKSLLKGLSCWDLMWQLCEGHWYYRMVNLPIPFKKATSFQPSQPSGKHNIAPLILVNPFIS